MRIVTQALAYFAAIFALGFVLGTVRTLWLAPVLGPAAAVTLELPVMLTASWWWAGCLHARAPLPSHAAALAMGALAFALLLLAELALGVWGFGQSLPEWFTALARLPGALGLAGQVGFGLMPWAVWGGAGA